MAFEPYPTLVSIWYALLALAAIVAYIPILTVLLRDKSEDFKTTFYFLVQNLAVADLIYLGTCVVYTTYVLSGRIYLSDSNDEFLGILQSMMKNITFYFILLIAIERVYSLARSSIARRIGGSARFFIVALGWLYGLFPALLTSTYLSEHGCRLSFDPVVKFSYAMVCEVWPPGRMAQLRTVIELTLCITILLLNIIIVFLLYRRRGSVSPGNENKRRKKTQRRLALQLISLSLILSADVLIFNIMNQLKIEMPPVMHFTIALLDSCTSPVVLLVFNPVMQAKIMALLGKEKGAGVPKTSTNDAGRSEAA